MCRFLAYKGAPITLDKLLYQPKNSLIRQSYKAQERPEPLNVVLTEGNWMVASRYVTDPALTPPTLYHSEGSHFECENGICRMHRTDPAEHAVLIVSEKLTEAQEDWHKVPPNHVVMVNHDLAVSVLPIKT
jgi:predicted glutamine amidotransferase